MKCKDCKVEVSEKNRPQGLDLKFMRKHKMTICKKCNDKYVVATWDIDLSGTES